MNKQEYDILNVILQYHCRNQRALAERCGFSLGMVNRSVKALQGQGFLTTDMELTEKARLEMAKHRPKNAVILAAGYGMRMVPINMETPKGLLEVEGEPLIERLIRQLHAVKVKEIYVVVGFKKEQYDYLVDQYGVKLVVNMEYAEKNNLHSLAKVLPQLGETYLMPCDLWCRENPFSEYEWYSWYLVSDAKDPDSTVRVSRKWELVLAGGEIPAMAIVDAVSRLIPGVLGDEICFTDESHWNGLLEYPQYSRPDEWHGLSVPEVLRSGDHAKVARWQKKQAILRTLHRRPDLFYKLRFPYKTRAERKFIAELEAEDDAFRDRNPKNLDYRK